MGNSPSQEISSNGCTQSTNIKFVSGLDETSASNSEQWELTMNTGRSVFLKFFLPPYIDECRVSGTKNHGEWKRICANSKKRKSALKSRWGLNYELRMYKYITNRALSEGMTGSFIKATTLLEGCSFNNLLDILIIHTGLSHKNIPYKVDKSTPLDDEVAYI